MIRSLIAVTAFIIFHAGYACADNITINGNGNAVNGSTINEGLYFPPILSYKDFLKLSNSIEQSPDSSVKQGHSSYWHSIYQNALIYARKGDYNSVVAICNDVIREGDGTHRSKCAALKDQVKSR